MMFILRIGILLPNDIRALGVTEELEAARLQHGAVGEVEKVGKSELLYLE